MKYVLILIALLAAACGGKSTPVATVAPRPTFTATAIASTVAPPATPQPTQTVAAVRELGIPLEPVATDTPFVATDPPVAVCDCSGDLYNCSDFASGTEAKACYDYCMATVGLDVHQLDRDGDDVMCESK